MTTQLQLTNISYYNIYTELICRRMGASGGHSEGGIEPSSGSVQRGGVFLDQPRNSHLGRRYYEGRRNADARGSAEPLRSRA